jgi:hypothetical protein
VNSILAQKLLCIPKAVPTNTKELGLKPLIYLINLISTLARCARILIVE